MPIRQLEPDVAAKIAAGEVVERPASVVKELIENSIDAGATQIRVDLMNGGLQLIRVSDNGSGIPVNELPLALTRHATSKVAQIDDLEHIRSLGFRGEALASIAAVAEVLLLSHHRDAPQGAQVSATNGCISDISAAGCPQGAIVTVRNLFSAVPARLKFLKSRNTEISHCHHLLEQYALAYPEIRFSVFSEGRQTLATTGDGQLSSVLIEIYGLHIAEQMIPLNKSVTHHPRTDVSSPPHLEGQDSDTERPIVTGCISRPTCYKSTRQHLSFFVNRRWVHSRMLTYAVEEAYHSLLLSGRHPIAVITIQLDPTLLDVNVHPAKTEIRFLKERRVYSAIQRTVRNALLEEAEMPEWEGKQGAATTHHIAVPSIRITPTDTPSLDTATLSDELPQDNPWLTVTEEETGTKPPMPSTLWQSHIRRPTNDPTSEMPAQAEHKNAEPRFIVGPPLVGKEAWGADTRDADTQPKLPPLRVLGQLCQSYIVTEGPDGMYLIDQHAAHERILLEPMVAALQARTPVSQLLLTPIQLQLAPTELEAIEDHIQQLERIGFTLAVNGHNSLRVQAVPSVLIKQMNAHSLHTLLAELTAPEKPSHAETWEEHALANVACKAAIKANYFLTVSEMRELIEQLEHTNAPYSCCHGRPTMVHFSLSALEREFGRR